MCSQEERNNVGTCGGFNGGTSEENQDTNETLQGAIIMFISSFGRRNENQMTEKKEGLRKKQNETLTEKYKTGNGRPEVPELDRVKGTTETLSYIKMIKMKQFKSSEYLSADDKKESSKSNGKKSTAG